MIDLHCHLDLYPDPKAVVKRCQQEKQFVLSVTTTPSAYRGTAALSNDKDLMPTALGLHPQLAAERHRELTIFDELLPSVKWVGEIGLDGTPECRGSWEVQSRVFDHILNSCTQAGGRLLSIHSRQAASSVLDALRSRSDSGIAILHWFSGTARELQSAIKMECWFSIGLPMLRTAKGRAIVSAIPRERLLTETDGPFTQNGLRPSYPWDTRETSLELSKLWGQTAEETELQLQNNLYELLSHLAGVP